MLSLPKAIPIQTLLYKTTTSLTQPVTTYFVTQMKKTCLKQPVQDFIWQRNGNQWIKNKRPPDYIYSITL